MSSDGIGADHGLDIRELTLPDDLSSDGREEVIEIALLDADISESILGVRDLEQTPNELLSRWKDPWNPNRVVTARRGGQLVGYGIAELPAEADSRVTFVWIGVAPAFRNSGIGLALAREVIRIAKLEGRHVLQGFSEHSASSDGARLEPPTGFGSIPADDPAARFLLAAGWKLEQVERISRLDLAESAHTVDRVLDLEQRAGSVGYDFVTWSGPTPPELLSDLANLHARMSTDAPWAGIEVDEEDWSEQRVKEYDARNAAAGYLALTTAARHRSSGRLVGFTDVLIPSDRSRPVMQEDTLILHEHRGHRLGMLIKAVNLRALRTASPESSSVLTYNAEENRHMLDVNEALGFVPIGYEGAWRDAN